MSKRKNLALMDSGKPKKAKEEHRALVKAENMELEHIKLFNSWLCLAWLVVREGVNQVMADLIAWSLKPRPEWRVA